jgi:all-trans-retinol dehydrogenase (NAD+)
MSQIKDAIVLITGGASGIGKLMGEMCLKEGAKRLIIWDIDRKKTEEFAAALNAKGYEVHTYITDVSKLDEIILAANDIKQKFGGVDILFNNAGVIVGKEFHQHTHKEVDFTMSINTVALMHVALEFIPGMIERKKGHIINIASAAGLFAVPKMSVYVASKHAVVGWSESVRLELEAVSKDLHVTTVTPSYINTGMFEGVSSPVVPILKPETAAKKIIAGVKKNKIFVRMPRIVYLLPFLKGILPQRWLDVIVGKWFGFHKSMDAFKGKQP